MDKATLQLELVPVDEAPGDDAPASRHESSPTTSRAQEVVTAAEASLDAIELQPVERTFPSAAPAATGDPFVAQATREVSQGQLDKPLWDHAMRQNKGDAAATAAMYIRARAISLRRLDRQRREPTRRVVALEVDDEPVIPEPSVWQRYKAAIVAAAVIVPAGIAGAAYMMSGGEETVAATPAVARVAAVAAAPEPAPTPAQLAAAKAEQANAVLRAKVQELRDVGNFNVMVLYATEWTRKEPDNAAAWDELRIGYVQLRQYEDARSAARKAVQIAPDDARLWRSLAAVNMDLDDPEPALAAYEQAVGAQHRRRREPQRHRAPANAPWPAAGGEVRLRPRGRREPGRPHDRVPA